MGGWGVVGWCGGGGGSLGFMKRRGCKTMDKMLEVYGVKEFCPMKSGNYRFTS